ncbi:MAG: imidazolonepropionase [Vulcanimicrobiaceae bacterium]
MPPSFATAGATVWVDARLATLDPRRDGAFGIVEDGALVERGGALEFVGPRSELPAGVAGALQRSLAGRLVTPGLVDPHTHLVYAGERLDEFEARLRGARYDELARAGGGILATVRATRAASEAELREASRPRLAALVANGATTVEIKSGYGLDRDTELRMLRVARALGEELGIRVRTTYLGLHALPPEFDDADAYVSFVIEEVLPEVARAGLADAVDAFCERIAFGPAQIERFFAAAAQLGFARTLHADQLGDGGGAELAARSGARSADHLEFASAEGIAALARSGTVAVLVPGATYVLREAPPPVDLLRSAGVPMAIASDCNPGTSPLCSLPLAMNFACVLDRLAPQEALAGCTREAARALGLGDRAGILRAGSAADFVAWDAYDPRSLALELGAQRAALVVAGGCEVAGTAHNPKIKYVRS